MNDLIAVLSARQRQEQDIDKDDQELIMKLSEMYQQQLEELKRQRLQEGRQEGRQEGIERERRAMIESIM